MLIRSDRSNWGRREAKKKKEKKMAGGEVFDPLFNPHHANGFSSYVSTSTGEPFPLENKRVHQTSR